MSTSDNRPRLVADSGGTNACFALDVTGRIYREQILAVADYDDIVAAITAYLQNVTETCPNQAVLAVAKPISGDQCLPGRYTHLCHNRRQSSFAWRGSRF